MSAIVEGSRDDRHVLKEGRDGKDFTLLQDCDRQNAIEGAPFLAFSNPLAALDRKSVHLAQRTVFSMQQHICRGSLGPLPLARGGRLNPSHVTSRQVVAASPQTTPAVEAFRRKSVIQLIAANVELNVSHHLWLVTCLILAVLF